MTGWARWRAGCSPLRTCRTPPAHSWPKGPARRNSAVVDRWDAHEGALPATFFRVWSGPPGAGRGLKRVCSEGEAMATGTLKFLSDDKGFGFITPADDGRDLFVHFSGFGGDGY